MQPGARVSAAIDVLTEILARGRTASAALADWARAHRFAGSGDRGAIGNLVFDALRKKQSHAFLMGADTARAIVLSVLAKDWQLAPAEIALMCNGEAFNPAPLTDEERHGLLHSSLESAPPWVQGDYPQWLHDRFAAQFGAAVIAEGQALSARAPIDLRVNTLKATREKVLEALARHHPAPTPYSPVGVRIPARDGAFRSPNVEADPAHGKGWFEIQDEASQIASLAVGASAGEQVLDLCAGAGGKTLALCAVMENKGQLYAYDTDAVRFRPIFERLKRAGTRNVQTLEPGNTGTLFELEGRLDRVVIDAPCTGTGVWRRKPDAKWRLSEAQLEARLKTQGELLRVAAKLLKPGGTLTYLTCSVLTEENELQVRAFLACEPSFTPAGWRALAQAQLTQLPCETLLAETRSTGRIGLSLSPARHGCDGFYVVSLRREH